MKSQRIICILFLVCSAYCYASMFDYNSTELVTSPLDRIYDNYNQSQNEKDRAERTIQEYTIRINNNSELATDDFKK